MSKTLSNRTKSGASPRSRRSAPAPIRQLVLRTRVVMADRGVRSVSALQRQLAAIGVAISLPQLIRVVDGTAKHLNKEVIEGLMTVFDCGIGELFAVT
ncbi:MAG: helix-turn-helix transcriptional regulator [Betaproteobacteria bacterium]|nr:helix-turn-helix transcriptional regulator [Betaproteobacteria bacterium]